VKEQKLKEIEQKKKELESFRTQKFGPNGEYFRRQQELLEPLQQRVLEAVNFISERDKFDYVFDRTGDYMFLYTNPEWDISEDVLLEMGIDIEDIDER
jgi:outer membrane protein